jgi:hypothetical protein
VTTAADEGGATLGAADTTGAAGTTGAADGALALAGRAGTPSGAAHATPVAASNETKRDRMLRR